VQDVKAVIMRMKNVKKIKNTELRYRDRTEVLYPVITGGCFLCAVCALCVV
jgi:hypothetical protein